MSYSTIATEQTPIALFLNVLVQKFCYKRIFKMYKKINNFYRWPDQEKNNWVYFDLWSVPRFNPVDIATKLL